MGSLFIFPQESMTTIVKKQKKLSAGAIKILNSCCRKIILGKSWSSTKNSVDMLVN